MKAICIKDCNEQVLGLDVNGADVKYISYIPGSFHAGRSYPVEIDHGMRIDQNGRVLLYLTIEVYDGSVDGYDRPSGLRFEYSSDFNEYFRIQEEER